MHSRHHDTLVILAAIGTLTVAYLAALLFLADPEPTTTEPQQRNVAAPARDAQSPSRGYARTAPPRPPAAGPVRATETATSPAPVVSDKPSRGKPAGTGAWPSTGLTPVLRCIRQQESEGNYRVVAWYNGRRYTGAWQFADPTWEWVTGLPAPASDYPKNVQDNAALELWAGGDGADQWQTAAGCGA